MFKALLYFWQKSFFTDHSYKIKVFDKGLFCSRNDEINC